MPIWVGCTPYFLDNLARAISFRSDSIAILALNSDEWLFRFLISDHYFHHAIHLNDWSEFPRPPLAVHNVIILTSDLMPAFVCPYISEIYRETRPGTILAFFIQDKQERSCQTYNRFKSLSYLCFLASC